MDNFAHEWSTPSSVDNPLQMDLLSELQADLGFEPQTRARSNTWPCPRPENFIDPNDELDSTKASNQQLANADSQQTVQNLNTTNKKNSSRRNAWGNLSYADLITHAIGSAADKRLTLSQIYEWMVQNVPYFKDKGDSNSSAGWKNSIRHNLSLHNRFMRVQNEGTGKSSWWMLNPDAKPGKSRSRAASMETSRYEKRRGRAKKRVEALRQAGTTGINDATPSPSSSVSEGLDQFSESPLHSFQLSPDCFRQRASSNASSCGRLSPIPALTAFEPEWGYTTADYQNTSITPAQANTMEKLAGSIADELKFQKDILPGFSAASGIPTQPPPPYQPQTYSLNGPVAQNYGLSAQQCLLHRTLNCSCMRSTSREGLSPNSVTTMSPAYPNSEPSSDSLNTYNTVVLDGASSVTTDNNGTVIIVQQQQQQPSSQQQQQQQQQAQTVQQQQQQVLNTNLEGQCMEALNNETPIDEFNIDNFHGGLECNLEELIQQEMSIDGTLDINIPLTAVGGSNSNNQQLISNIGLSLGNNVCLNGPTQTQTTTTTNLTASQLNQLQAQIKQQQQQQQQQHQQQQQQQQQQQSQFLSPLLMGNNNNSSMGSGLELGSTSANTNMNAARVQYSQTNVVTPPSWVH